MERGFDEVACTSTLVKHCNLTYVKRNVVHLAWTELEAFFCSALLKLNISAYWNQNYWIFFTV